MRLGIHATGTDGELETGRQREECIYYDVRRLSSPVEPVKDNIAN